LLDEPSSNLDSAGQELISALLQSHVDAGGMVILATHQAIEMPGTDCRYWRAPQEVV
jgi:heme exporter protein A